MRLTTIKAKIIFYFMILTVVPIILFSYIYYSFFQQNIKDNIIQNSRTNLKYIMSNVDKQLQLAERNCDWALSSKQLDEVLTMEYKGDSEQTQKIIQYTNNINEYILSNLLSKFISKMVIIGLNGVQIQIGNGNSVIDVEKLYESGWFDEPVNQVISQGSVGLRQLPDKYSTSYVFPFSRTIINSITGEVIGYNIITFKSNLVEDVFNDFNASNQDEVFIINEEGQCISHLQNWYIGKNFKEEPYIGEIIEEGSGYKEVKIEKTKYIYNYYRSPNTNWIIVQKSNVEEYYHTSDVYQSIFIMIIGILVCILLLGSLYLSFTITKPIKKILHRLNLISTGIFEVDSEIEGDDELGIIGSRINKMSLNIKQLISKLLEEEKLKNDLEFTMLQNQINPHFLYNTLNSIKWMAQIQNAIGIRDMTGALARILQNLFKQTNEKILLYEEFLLIDDYIYIQNIRYNGKFNFKYDVDKRLMMTKILKFTLQPIIENSIFHGVEPKKDVGNILVSAKREEDDLLIRIMDDGVGMSKEKIKQILSHHSTKKNKSINAIGVANVDKRLKLTYGEDYGITIKSKEGEYTTVMIKIPYEE